MKTRNEIVTELDKIELECKAITVVSDNNGNFEMSEKLRKLYDREDELMELLNDFPL